MHLVGHVGRRSVTAQRREGVSLHGRRQRRSPTSAPL
jgi:hypothetical protein